MVAIRYFVFAIVVMAVPRVAAFADVPPPPGYVEGCTVEKQQKKGEACQSCRAWHGERDKCSKTLGKNGYSQRCKTRGASAWSEVWCKRAAKGTTKKPDAPPVPTKNDAVGGGTLGGDDDAASPWLKLALASVALLGALFLARRFVNPARPQVAAPT